MAKNDAGGPAGNTDDNARGRGIPRGGRPAKSGSTGKAGGKESDRKATDPDVGGGPIGGRGKRGR